MADSSVTVERVKIGYVFGGQLEVPDVQILLNPRLVDRFRNGDVAPLDLILQNNLRRGLLVLGSDLYNFCVFCQFWIVWFGPRPVRRSQRTVRRHNDPFGPAESY
jgi:hypothetical protein